MLNRNFKPFISTANFLGVNAKDTSENMSPGEWHRDSINVYSNPQGAIGSRPGYTTLTTASIGTATAWCGFYEYQKHAASATTQYYIGGGSDGKVYNYASSAFTELLANLTTTKGVNKRYSFFTLDNTAVITTNDELCLKWTGTGSAATIASSVTADFGLEWQRYGWLHSVVDSRLIYYSPLGDPDGAYTSFLNFDMDNKSVIGAAKNGDDMLVGKEDALYKVQYRGASPLFKIYRIPSKVGPVSHFTMKELPDGSVVFLASDANFYRVVGNMVIPVGDNIQPYVKDGVYSRLKYAVSGILSTSYQYWCSFTYTSGVTTNDRTVLMDWSRPYLDKWGKTQYPWFIYSIGANCFAEVSVSGEALLYHGGYTGLMYKDNTGTNDNGSAFSSTYKNRVESHGDRSLEKKYGRFEYSFVNKGDWDLTMSFVVDENASTEKILTQNMNSGVGFQSLFDVAKFDEDYFATEECGYKTKDIMRQGKTIQASFGTTALDAAWLMYYYIIHAKPLRRVSRTSE